MAYTLTQAETYAADAARFASAIIDDITAAERLNDLLVAGLNGTASESDDYAEIIQLATALEIDVDDHELLSEVADRLDQRTSEWGYGSTVHTVVRVILAGGGPEGWIDFTVDEKKRLVSAEIGYRDWWQQPVTVALTDEQASAAFTLYRIDILADPY
jgi:hypothetical protein